MRVIYQYRLNIPPTYIIIMLSDTRIIEINNVVFMYNFQVTRKVRAGSTVGIGSRLPDEKKIFYRIEFQRPSRLTRRMRRFCMGI